MSLIQVIKALLFAAQKPLPARELLSAIKGAGGEDDLLPNEFARATEAQVAAALEELKIGYVQQGRAFQLTEKAEGWQLVSDPAYRSRAGALCAFACCAKCLTSYRACVLRGGQHAPTALFRRY